MIVEAAFEAYEDARIDNPQQQIEAIFAAPYIRQRARPKSPMR